MRLSLRVVFDLQEHLAPALARQVQIQEDEGRTWRMSVFAAPVQEVNRLDSVLCDAERHGKVSFFERLLSQPDIARIVLDKKDVDGGTPFLPSH